jgi:phosphate transport system permease protein
MKDQTSRQFEAAGKTGDDFQSEIGKRHRVGSVWRQIFQGSTVIGIIVLSALLFNVINQTFGLAAVEVEIAPESLAIDGVPLEELSQEQLIVILEENVSKGLFRRFESEQPLAERDREEVYELVFERVVEPKVVKTWSLIDSIFNQAEVEQERAEKYPDSSLDFFSWIDPAFVSSPQSSDPLRAGVRTAIFGSLWTIAITILFSFPIGVGAAIYLEEYAGDSFINRLIQTNINNLAGVPSIIYGILGLAIS